MMIGRTHALSRFGNGGTGIPTYVTVTPNQATTVPATVAVTPNQFTAGGGGGGFLTSLLNAGTRAGITALNAPAARAQAQQKAAQAQSMTTLFLIGGGLLLFFAMSKK